METLFPEKHKVAMASEPIMSAPMCLVENKNQQMSVNQRALKILYKISQPVVVVAIVGVYRTGKSYLMNCLAGEKLGFPLGSTVQSETKGIWMWCVPHPSKHDHTLVLLDTEGLGDVEKGDSKNDSWIFALSVLLSSTLVYNSMSTINNDALEKLHYVTELTEFIRAKSSPTRSEEDSSEFVSFFPDFIWAVRDFTLELKLNGHPITEDEYLENSLKLIPGLNPRAKNSNIPRECIRNYFPKRKCFVFDRPTKETELLAKLETILESQLDPKFREQSDKFCYYIFNHAKTKLLREGVKVTGNRLGTLVVTYVDTINSGAVPCLENAVTALAELENSAAVQKAADHYTEQMAQRVSFPTDSLQELLDLHAACEREAIAIFMERSFKDDKRGFQTKLMSDPENDSWIFALAVLLSSMLVYNSVDTINHQALEQLHYVTELTKLIRTKSSPSSGEVDDSAEFVSFFPDFVWAVRDFLLELKLNGRTITEDEYLENALKLIPGFPLGSTVRSKTKGIWMWCVPHPSKLNHTLVLLDTEGLADVEKSDPENDSWIFALAVLLSSMLVYNSVGTINHQALEQLHYVTELTKLIRTKSSPSSGEVDDSAEFVSFFPDFVWAVRDFLLELKLDGRTITEDEYLENALKLIPGEDPKIQKSNMPREYIRKFFPRRKCFVFDWPTNDKKLLQHMEKVSENQLGREFQEQSRTFCTYIFTHAKTKTLRQGITVTGNGLGTLAKAYVDAINSGAVPCLENAVTALAELENSAAVQKAADHYTEQMAQRVSFPTDSLQELLDLHAACEREAIAIFMERSFKDDKREFQKKLVETIELKKGDFLLQNEQASGKYCQAQLEQLSEPLKDDISRGTFSVPGGHNLYLEAVEKLEQSYNLVPRKGVKSDPENDSWIFALAVLLSSMFVYNSVGTINHQALEQLHYVTELTKLIRTKSSPSSGEVDDSADFVSFFPDFVWAVRDFLLELKLDGRTITEDEYLENALKLIPGEDPKIQKSNMPREYIRKFFPRRKCFVFDWPTNDKKLLQHMEKVSENQLGREFQEQSRTFCTYIFTHAKTKTLRQGITVTGNGLGTLAKAYVDAINSGAVPCLENAVTALAELENSAAVQKAADHYTEQMAQRVSFPTDSLQELLDLHAACEREAIAIFMERSFKDDKREFQKKLVSDPENDSWIFALAVLLSSMLVYNSVGTINHQALEQLHYVTELTKLIRTKSSPSSDEEDDSAEFVSFFPDFVWAVRDFLLELKLDGRTITEDEYLENALKLIPGEDPQIQKSNLPREYIRKFFPRRKCFVFDQPTNDKKLLLHMQEVSENQLEGHFQEQSKNFCQYILTHASTKNLREKIITGNGLGTLAKAYVDTINSGVVPCLENAVTALAELENSAAVQKAADHYTEQMAQRVSFPTDSLQELLDLHAACEREAIAIFMERSFKDDKRGFQKKLVEIIEMKKEDFLLQNEQASGKYCQAQLEQLSEPLMDDISRGTFSVPGGYNLYLEAMDKFEQSYNLVPRKGVKANEVLQTFLQSQAATKESILQADQALSAEEKALAAMNAKNQKAEKELELLRQKQKEEQEKMEAQDKSFQENLVQLKEKIRKGKENRLTEQKRMLEHKQKIQEELLVEGFEKESEEMGKEINQLKEEIEETENIWPSIFTELFYMAATLMLEQSLVP
ncbi:uncharacterized protein WM277_023603 isoform 4-T4 [Molossus nigricans]